MPGRQQIRHKKDRHPVREFPEARLEPPQFFGNLLKHIRKYFGSPTSRRAQSQPFVQIAPLQDYQRALGRRVGCLSQVALEIPEQSADSLDPFSWKIPANIRLNECFQV